MPEFGQDARDVFEAVYDHVLKGTFRQSIVASYSEAFWTVCRAKH